MARLIVIPLWQLFVGFALLVRALASQSLIAPILKLRMTRPNASQILRPSTSWPLQRLRVSNHSLNPFSLLMVWIAIIICSPFPTTKRDRKKKFAASLFYGLIKLIHCLTKCARTIPRTNHASTSFARQNMSSSSSFKQSWKFLCPDRTHIFLINPNLTNTS